MGIVVDPDARFNSTAPIIVIGAGGAGAIAALAASSGGANVLVLERDAAPSGATACSSGMVPAAGTAEQTERGVVDSPQRFADDIQAKANGAADAPLVEALTHASAQVLEWLTRQYRIRFELVEGVAPGHSLSRMHALADRGGATLLSSLYSALGTQGVRLETNARVTDLVVDGAQKILGVRYKRNGSVETMGCATLILACNGFAGNRELVTQYLPDVRGLPFAGHDGSQGDALSWGAALGAKLADIDGFLAHGAVVMSLRLPLPWSLMTEGAVQVNRDGERFINEHEGYSESALFVLAQPDALAYMIYDERVHEIGLTMPNYANAVSSRVIKRAATLRDLADQIGVYRDGLEGTIGLVNALAFEDAADEFGRQFRATQMLLGPYYGVPVTGALLGTEGGLAIDAAGRVLRENGSAFANLFAAGGAARGVSGDAAGGYLEGNGLLTAVVGGYLAGKAAAAQVRS
ncbi:MAG: FAD-dependent oxidoreductase [Burkholderiaceae bacterium]|nr:FAD-dependent oxidoreductase [Burkholderiaceae bacterium]